MKFLKFSKQILFGLAMLTSSWLVAQPTITAIKNTSGSSITSASIGSTILIEGTNFSSTASDNIIRIQGVECDIDGSYTSSSTKLYVQIPEGVVQGRIMVTNTNTNLACQSSQVFFVRYSSSAPYDYMLGEYAFDLGTTLSTTYNAKKEYDITEGIFQVTDVDDDGYLDLIGWDGNGLVWYENQSDASSCNNNSACFSTQKSIVAPTAKASSYYRDISTIDFDNDGDIDFIYNTGGAATLMENTGGSFSSKSTNISSNTWLSEAVDLDNNGYFDIFSAGANSRHYFNLMRGRAITAQNTTPFATSSVYDQHNDNSAGGAAVGNLNGSGTLDLIEGYSYNAANPSYDIITSNMTSAASGTSISVNSTNLSSSSGSNKICIDLDNNGYDEIITYQRGSSNLLIARNTGTTSFTQLSISGNRGVAFADIDNDGKLDLFNSDGTHIYMRKNQSTSSTISFGSSVKVANAVYIDYFVMADINHDGYPDIIGNRNGGWSGNSDDFKILLNQVDDRATVTESITAFNTCGTGSTSSSQTLTFSASSLGADPVVAVPTGFGISQSATGTYSSSTTVSRTSGAVSNKTLYIKRTSTTAGTVTGDLTIKDGSTTIYSKTLTGTVATAPTITGNEHVLSGSTNSLTGSGTAASSNPWVSATTSAITITDGGVASYVSSNTSVITYTDQYGCTATKTLGGVAIASSLTSFSRVSGATATAQTFTVSSGQLTNNLTITAPSGYEVSTDNSTYSSSVSLGTSSAAVSSTTIYIKMSGSTALTTYSGNVTVKNGTTTIQSIAVSGYIESATYTLKSGKESDINDLSSWEDANGNSPSSWDAPRTFTLSGTGPYTFTSSTTSWNMTGNLVLSSGGTLNIGSGQTLTVSGTGSFTNSGTVGTSSGTIVVSNTATLTNSGTLTIGTLTYNGTAAQTLGGTTTIGTINNDNTGGVTFTAAQTITTMDVDNDGDVTLGGTTTVTNLDMADGNLNLNGHSLTISGTLTTNANAKFAAGTSSSNKTGSQLTIDPSTAFSGSLYFDENANTFQKIVIGDQVTATFANSVNMRGGSGSSNPGILEIENGGSLTIASGKTLTLKSGQINAMLSLPGAATSILSGDIAIERAHLGARGWRIYTHPFNFDLDLTEVADDIEVIGSGGTSAGFYSDVDTNSSAYYYDYTVTDANRDQTNHTDLGWKAFTKANDASSEPWAKASPVIIYNCGGAKGNGFKNPQQTVHQDGVISLDYTVGNTNNVNDGDDVEVDADPDGLWYYLCNPYTAPVKLKDISGFSTSDIESTVYYWRQRRASISNLWPYKNRMPADWQAVDWTAASNEISIPAFSAILLKFKSGTSFPHTFTFEEQDKQLTDFDHVMGATLGSINSYSDWNDMFTEVYQPTLGDNSFLLGLNIADTAEVDNVMIFDADDMSTQFDNNDGIKYQNEAFPNIYTLSQDDKALANDKQNITQRLKAGEASVEIPLVITNKQDLPYDKLTLFVKEFNSELVVYLKDNQTNQTTLLNLWDRFDINFDGDKKAPIEKYSLVFELMANSNTDIAQAQADIQVFPNPADGIIRVKTLEQLSSDEFEIFDITGRSVKSGNMKNSTIDIKDLSMGQYILNVGSFNTRFIKK